MFERMKTTQKTVYMARCANCKETYGFVSPTERDAYVTTWHSGHKVACSAEELA